MDEAPAPPPPYHSPAVDPPAGTASAPDGPAPPEVAARSGRIRSLDLIRGVAILGILPANMPHYKSAAAFSLQTAHDTWGDRLAAGLTHLLIDGKMVTLLSILFGAGLFLQYDAARRSGRRFAPYYIRRLALLFGIGVFHTLFLWWGDILAEYAWVALITMGLALLPDRALTWICGLLLAMCGFTLLGLLALGLAFGPLLRGAASGSSPAVPSPVVRYASTAAAPSPPSPEPSREAALPGTGRMDELPGWARWMLESITPQGMERIYRRGSYPEMLAHRALFLAADICNFWFAVLWFLLPLFGTGVLLLRRGIFHDPTAHLPLLRRIRTLGLAIGVPLSLLAAGNAAAGGGMLVTMALYYLGAYPQALGYLTLLLFWSLSSRAAALQRRLEAVGRMALTNYLGQSVICGFLFYSYGLKLFGQVDRLAGLGFVALIWAAQLLLSPLWLRYFEMGPVEWAWRSLADGRRRPFRRTAPQPL